MPAESIGKMLSTLFIPGVIESYITSSKDLFTASKYKRALSNLRHKKNATYYAIEEINPLKMASTFASPSVIKMSKSRWTDTDERISYNNTAMLSFV